MLIVKGTSMRLFDLQYCNQRSCLRGVVYKHMKYIEDLFLRPAVKKAIILLLYRADIKVLKDALAHLGPYPTLTSARCSDPGD